jgi:hypothetical protein
MYAVYMSILSRFPTPHHQAQQNFNKLLIDSGKHGIRPEAQTTACLADCQA